MVPGHTDMSVIAPTELRIDSVCCVGLSSHGTLSLHNPSVHWMQVQLTVTQISINGQPSDHHVSPFSLKPKVTIDPNSTESVKVIESLLHSVAGFRSLLKHWKLDHLIIVVDTFTLFNGLVATFTNVFCCFPYKREAFNLIVHFWILLHQVLCPEVG